MKYTDFTADENEYCPECQIGLNNAEIRVGKCINCGATWNPADLEREAIEEDED
jgi:hypothetical protein